MHWVLIIYSFIGNACRFLKDYFVDTRQSKTFQKKLSSCIIFAIIRKDLFCSLSRILSVSTNPTVVRNRTAKPEVWFDQSAIKHF